MSGFRPSARAVGPDGRDWEIYAYKVKRTPRAGRRRLRHLRDDAHAALRALRADDWTVEAQSWGPPQSYRWTTTGEYLGQVLAQVEAGLNAGDVPRPRNAVYAGWSRSAR